MDEGLKKVEEIDDENDEIRKVLEVNFKVDMFEKDEDKKEDKKEEFEIKLLKLQKKFLGEGLIKKKLFQSFYVKIIKKVFNSSIKSKILIISSGKEEEKFKQEKDSRED